MGSEKRPDVQLEEMDVTMYKENGIASAYSDYVNDEGLTMHLLYDNYDDIDATALRLPGQVACRSSGCGKNTFDAADLDKFKRPI